MAQHFPGNLCSRVENIPEIPRRQKTTPVETLQCRKQLSRQAWLAGHGSLAAKLFQQYNGGRQTPSMNEAFVFDQVSVHMPRAATDEFLHQSHHVSSVNSESSSFVLRQPAWQPPFDSHRRKLPRFCKLRRLLVLPLLCAILCMVAVGPWRSVRTLQRVFGIQL